LLRNSARSGAGVYEDAREKAGNKYLRIWKMSGLPTVTYVVGFGGDLACLGIASNQALALGSN
jgi:hypothetical protein